MTGAMQWPSAILRDVLMGHMAMEDAPLSVQSWARLPIHQAATEICDMGTLEERRRALAKIPERIRPYVETEIRRIWP